MGRYTTGGGKCRDGVDGMYTRRGESKQEEDKRWYTVSKEEYMDGEFVRC